jgi:hypothetical protein
MVKNLAHLAKKGNSQVQTKVTPIVKSKVVEPKTIEEPKIVTPKEMISNLLEDINTLTKAPVEVVIPDEIQLTTEEKEASTWLQEQVALLSEESELLRSEIRALQAENDGLRNNYGGVHENGLNSENNDNRVASSVINLFNELQNNLISMGVNQQTGKPNLFIAPVEFLKRMIMYFPFLDNEKKF